MKTLLLTLSLAVAGVGAAHAQVYQPTVGRGAAVGAIAGALIGGHNNDRWAEGAIIGAAAGALFGAVVDQSRPQVYERPPVVVSQAPTVGMAPTVGEAPPTQVVYQNAPQQQVVYETAPAPQQVVYVTQPAPRVVYVTPGYVPAPVIVVQPGYGYYGYSGYGHHGRRVVYFGHDHR